MNVPIDDGLYIPRVGHWSRDKHHFLMRYIDAFTTAMKDKRWSGLHYVDLFAGAGVERIDDTGQLEWGSPLIAAQAKSPFRALHLVERDSTKHIALTERLKRVRSSPSDQVLLADANQCVHEIVDSIPPRSLTLAFLDPYGLHLDFSTLRALSSRRADLIIFFPDRLDILRNWEAYYWDNANSNLDCVLGDGSNWREKISSVPPQRQLDSLLEVYCGQIRKLGYTHFEWEPIPNAGTRLYKLIFCSRVKIAAKIWQGISSLKPGGQRSLPFQ